MPKEKTRCNGTKTEAAFKSWIKSLLRKGSTRWAPAQTCLKEAEVGRKINQASGRLAMHYRCAHCHGSFARKQVSIDHIDPVVPVDGPWPGWDVIVERMYPEKEGFQVLCDGCHANKTEAEREARKHV